jgi:hypothetical protein
VYIVDIHEDIKRIARKMDWREEEEDVKYNI